MEQLLDIRPYTLLCPKCKCVQITYDLVWCGKNLFCKSCEEYSYYSDWLEVEVSD